MLDTYEKFRISSIGDKTKDFFVEVNYSDAEEVKDCQILKITFPNGEQSFIKREHLHAILFAIGNPEEQSKLIPQKLTRVRWFESVVSVKATKDIRKGESITFPIKLSLPNEEKEVVGPIRGQLLTGRSIKK